MSLPLKPILHGVGRWCLLVLVAGLSVQVFFALSIASMNLWMPLSTAFQRTAVWENLAQSRAIQWQHTPVAGEHISDNARKAVIASEDNLFFSHQGVDWDAIERAWQRNAHNERILGGSTITQQLAKNLYLSGERSMLRKLQELLLAWTMEATLSKQRILDIYLNEVEWGDGLYGIEAAAQHYFNTSAAKLSAAQAARLAVMLPQPRRFEANPHSAYLNQRTATITRRMGAIELPSTP